MKLWLDDVRPAPEGWVWCKTAREAKRVIADDDRNELEEISFDHDLGSSRTGYDVATFIEALAASGMMRRLKWTVHSANPVGRRQIEAAMKSAERYWAAFEKLKGG